MLALVFIGILIAVGGTIWCGYKNDRDLLPFIYVIAVGWPVAVPFVVVGTLLMLLYYFGQRLSGVEPTKRDYYF